AARRGRAVAGSLGLHRTRAPAGAGRDRGEHLAAERAAHARRPAAQALAQPPLAASPRPARRRVRAPHEGDRKPAHARTVPAGDRAERGPDGLPAAAAPSGLDPAGPAGEAGPGRARVRAERRPAPVRRLRYAEWAGLRRVL